MQKSKLLITLLFFLAILPVWAGNVAFAQSRTWNGNVSSDWNNAANWQNGNIPGPTHNVTIPANSTHWPVISSVVNIRQLTLTNWSTSSATPLTVITGGKLTISNKLELAGNGQLHIDGGEVILEGSEFTSYSYDYATIEVTTGSFISYAAMKFDGGNDNIPAFSIGDGSMILHSYMQVANTKWAEINGSGTLDVYGENPYDSYKNVVGSLYVGDGTANFYGRFTVGSGGHLYLDSGSINFHDYAEIGNNGHAFFGEGTVNFFGNAEVLSSGYLHIEDATVNVVGNVTFVGNGNLTVDTGTLNIGGNAELYAGGTMDLNNGNLNVAGNASFTGGSVVNAGNSTITLGGDISIQNDSNFRPDSSTVIFNGSSTQTIHVDHGDVTFYNVVVDSGAVIQSDGDSENTIIIENDLTVHSGGNVIVQDDDQINVKGDLDDEDETVVIDRPFIRHITTPDLNTVIIEYDKDMEKSPMENVGNYSINKGVVVHNAVQDPNNARFVTLTVSTLIEDEEYELIANKQMGTNGFAMLDDHIKRFGADTIVSFYSRQNGNWASNSTWSTGSLSGPAASKNPANTSNATVVIGTDHIVTINTSVTLEALASVTVNDDAKLVVAENGVLDLGNDIISGTGTFELTSGTIEIGSVDGISQSGSVGNIQTATRIFGSDASYIYNGNSEQQTGSGLPTDAAHVEIDNPANVRLSNNLEVTETLSLSTGSLIIPSGYNLIANNKDITSGNLIMEREITGTTGWRLISSPLQTSFADLLDATITQGYPGAFYSTGSMPGDTLQPNVLFYEESYPGTDNQRWRAPVNASTNIPAGQGLYTFFFGDVAGDSRYNLPLPLTLTAQGQENEGDGTKVDFNITFTAAADSGWNLVGNPYAATIDWDNDAEWNKSKVDNTIYVWDNATNNYKTWNGITGDLASGLIAPFQGFWVKANAENPVLQVNKEAKTFGNTFVGKQKPDVEHTPHISLQLSDGENSISTHLMFSDEASIGKDAFDAYRLVPPPGIMSFVDMATVSRDGGDLAINNLPRKFGRAIEIPVYVNAFENGMSVGKNLKLSWNTAVLPEGWTVTLVDNQSKAKIFLDQSTSYSFANTKLNNSYAPNVQGKNQVNKARFTLIIEPGSDADNLPSTFLLEQNYPNPFNPTTKIQFELPVQTIVDLSIFDMLGRHIATIVKDELSVGTHIFDWDASQLASGIYLYRLATAESVTTKKMTLIK